MNSELLMRVWIHVVVVQTNRRQYSRYMMYHGVYLQSPPVSSTICDMRDFSMHEKSTQQSVRGEVTRVRKYFFYKVENRQWRTFNICFILWATEFQALKAEYGRMQLDNIQKEKQKARIKKSNSNK